MDQAEWKYTRYVCVVMSLVESFFLRHSQWKHNQVLLPFSIEQDALSIPSRVFTSNSWNEFLRDWNGSHWACSDNCFVDGNFFHLDYVDDDALTRIINIETAEWLAAAIILILFKLTLQLRMKKSKPNGEERLFRRGMVKKREKERLSEKESFSVLCVFRRLCDVTHPSLSHFGDIDVDISICRWRVCPNIPCAAAEIIANTTENCWLFVHSDLMSISNRYFHYICGLKRFIFRCLGVESFFCWQHSRI